jgi:amino acid transporter
MSGSRRDKREQERRDDAPERKAPDDADLANLPDISDTSDLPDISELTYLDDPALNAGEAQPAATSSVDDQEARGQDELHTGLERREVVHSKRRNADYVRVQYSGRRQFRQTRSGALEATQEAIAPQSGAGRAWERFRRALLGERLSTAEQANERLSKVKGLAILSSDAISSVAYATEASLGVLILAGAATMQINLILAGCIAFLMIIVGSSYRQTIYAYPQGGGSYIVARDNLGDMPGLIAAAALLIDYVLTVSVSVSAGVDALVSAVRPLLPYTVELGVAFIVIIAIVNLRGVRESGSIFAAPTYLFIGVFLLMILVGIINAAFLPGGLTAHIPAVKSPDLGWGSENLSLLLILTAFASGCSAMTGVEAISNGVPAFKKPETHNAARTLVVMIAILVTLFLGTTYLAWRFGIAPHASGEPTVTSQIAETIFTGTFAWLYYVLQLATLLILVLAANTSFSGFPWLSSILARDNFLPHQFSNRGGRLAFSVGIIVLSVLAITLMVIFHGHTEALINLYAVGVFTAFTLSQSGMVIHWWRLRRDPSLRWRQAMIINLVGAISTGIVATVITVTKFIHGAWIVVALIPLFVLLFKAISRHYASTAEQVKALKVNDLRTYRQVMVVPIAQLDHVAQRSIAYAQALADEVIVVHITTDTSDSAEIRRDWNAWLAQQARQTPGERKPRAATGAPITRQPEATEETKEAKTEKDKAGAEQQAPRLVVIESPYRALTPPLVAYVDALRDLRPDAVITVVLPEFVPAHWWERALHNQTALRLKLALYSHPNVVVANVPYHLR